MPKPFDAHDPKSVGRAVRRMAKSCPVIEAAYKVVGVADWRHRPGGYAGVCRIIAYQLISTKAAATIWGRVEGGLGEVTPKAVLSAPEDKIRSFGMSGPKVRHMRSVAEAVESGSLDFERLAGADDDAARKELVAVKGIGPWTADVYLLSCLGRENVFPHADIGLSESYRMLAAIDDRPSPKEFLQIAERWQPYRGVAAHMLWAYINHTREQESGGA